MYRSNQLEPVFNVAPVIFPRADLSQQIPTWNTENSIARSDIK